jgi:hypothetical protein
VPAVLHLDPVVAPAAAIIANADGSELQHSGGIFSISTLRSLTA